MLKKTNLNTLVGVVYGFCAVFMLIAVFVPSEIRLTMTGVVTVFSLLIIAFFVVPMLCKENRLQLEEGNRVIGSIKSTLLSQEIVDQRFIQLADQYAASCKRQVESKDVDVASREVASIQEAVAETKSAFWAAHAMAKDLGYEVKATVGDYTTMPKAPARRRSSAGRLAAP